MCEMVNVKLNVNSGNVTHFKMHLDTKRKVLKAYSILECIGRNINIDLDINAI